MTPIYMTTIICYRLLYCFLFDNKLILAILCSMSPPPCLKFPRVWTVIALFCAFGATMHAQTNRFWDAIGANDYNWSTAANWAVAIPDSSTQAALFSVNTNTGLLQSGAYNISVDPGLTIAGIRALTSVGTSTATVTVSGSPITLANTSSAGAQPFIWRDSGPLLVVQNHINVDDADGLLFRGAGSLWVQGNITLNSGATRSTDSGTTFLGGDNSNWSGGFVINRGTVTATSINGLNLTGTVTLGTSASNINIYFGTVAAGTTTVRADFELGAGTHRFLAGGTGSTLELTSNNFQDDYGGALAIERAVGDANYGIAAPTGNGTVKFSGTNLSIGRTLSVTNSLLELAPASGSQTWSGNIGNFSTQLIKSGEGLVLLSGTNTYTAVNVVQAGILQFAQTNSLPSSAKTRFAVENGAAVAFNVGGTGEFTAAGISTILTNLTVNINNDGLKAGSAIGFDTTNADGGVFSYANVIANSTGTGAGSLGVLKLGQGTLILSGNNTYSGNTIVRAGTLLINGAHSGNGSLTVVEGATLGGSGSIGGSATIRGIHSPGNSPGIQTFDANLTYAGGSAVVEWELTANSTIQGNPTETFDQIFVQGNLDFSESTTLTLNFALPGSAVDWSDALWSGNITGTTGWLIYNVGGSISNFANLSILVENWTDGNGLTLNDVRAGASFSLYLNGGEIYLNYAIPEPSTSILLGLTAAVYAITRRRRQH